MSLDARLRAGDRAADGRARVYAGELRSRVDRFEREMRSAGVAADERLADELEVFLFDVRAVFDRMEGTLAAAAVLPFGKERQLEHAGAGIGQPNDRTSSTVLARRATQTAATPDAWSENLGPCQVCTIEGGSCRGPIQGHHIIAKRFLKNRGLVEHLFDLRDRLPVCEHRHEQHTSSFKPIPRAALPAAVFEFAAELGVGWYLDRFYPAADGAA